MSEVENRLRAYYDGEMADRASRPLGTERAEHVAAFSEYLRTADAAEVLEVGCGAGRDGSVLIKSGCGYVGVDLSLAAVRTCRERGLVAVEASASDLPFEDNSFGAVWSMSTLMHLQGDGFNRAIAEIGRVARPGGVVEIGVWGHTVGGERIRPDGRYFNHRTDAHLRDELGTIGDIADFNTWDWFDDGGHYQWAKIVAR